MSTLQAEQAEQVLKHTFKQLEKMLDDVRRQGTVSPSDDPAGKRKAPRKTAAAPGKRKR